jgi:Trp operon repressor
VAAITREEFQEWQANPVTKRLMQRITKDVEELKLLAMGISPEDLKELQGRYTVAARILNVEYEELFDE